MPLLAALSTLCATLCGLAFVLAFVAWLRHEPAFRIGPFRPQTWLTLALFTLLCALTCALIP